MICFALSMMSPVCDKRMRRRARSCLHSLRALAAGETKASDPGAPVETARGLQVLVRIIKGSIIAGVDRYSTVVAPSMQAARLRPAAGLEQSLGLESSERIARQPPGVVHTRILGAARGAVAQSNVAGLVHGNTTHPARRAVRRVGCLLHHRGRTAGEIAQLIPADPHDLTSLGAAHLDAMIDHRSLGGARRGTASIGEALHEAIGERIEPIRRAGLRDAGAPAAGFG